jgi:hypothetical protein
MQKNNNYSKLLEPFLFKSKGQITPADASSLTGLSNDQAKQALAELSQKYHCKLKVTENGDLIYDFGQLSLRGQRSWAEFFELVQNFFWNVFKAIFKVWISVTLIIYFGLFLFLVLTVLLASSDKKKDSKSSSIDIGFIFALIRSIFIAEKINATFRQIDEYGYSYRVPDRTQKNFINSVYDFVFGPPRVQRDSLEQEKEFTAFLHQNKGIATVSDVIAISGMSREQASDFFSLSLINFNGEPKIDEQEAVLYGEYRELLRVADPNQKRADVVYYWDEFEAPLVLTGNSSSRNIQIALMNALNLISGFVFIYVAEEISLQILLGYIPFVFSLIFFSIPVLRYFKLEKQRAQLIKANLRRALMKSVFENRSRTLTAEKFVALAYGETPPSNALRVFTELSVELEAQSEPSEQGMCYRFETLERELNFVENFRSKYQSDNSLGKIEFESF